MAVRPPTMLITLHQALSAKLAPRTTNHQTMKKLHIALFALILGIAA
jgi:hypothetical protein